MLKKLHSKSFLELASDVGYLPQKSRRLATFYRLWAVHLQDCGGELPAVEKASASKGEALCENS